ncbi:hypothetical protein PFISCL1PPCAC_18794, partial [Pristionchus fissidentatus]
LFTPVAPFLPPLTHTLLLTLFPKAEDHRLQRPSKMAAGSNNQSSNLPRPNDIIVSSSSSYRLGLRLGDGGYGVVFMCRGDKDDRMVAIKIEKYNRSMLPIEIEVMRNARKKGCKHFVEPIDHGSKPPDYTFVVMTLLNKDLHKMRNEQADRKFSRSTAYRIGIQTMEAIQELHGIGYISRDVKPGNFAPGLRENIQHRVIFMFDFGLARKHLDKNGNVIPQRKEIGWRGTSRYGSLEAHRRKDLGRRDDVESWFYLLIEVTIGALPWRLVPDRATVYQAKMYARNEGRKNFFSDCPKAYDEFMTKIDALTYVMDIPYEYFLTELRNLCKTGNYREREAFDWDEGEESRSMAEAKSQSSYSEDDNKKEMSDPNCHTTQDQ